MGVKAARLIQPYPKRKTTGIKRTSISNVNWDFIRQPRPRLRARSLKYKTTLSRDLDLESRAVHFVRGSLQERIFYKALLDHKFIDGIDFTFQTNQLGGRAELGGLVADFLFPEPVMVIVQVQSVWHTMSLYNVLRDKDQAQILGSLGYQVLELWPTTIEDPQALEDWINHNIAMLWGTSSGGQVGGGSNTYTWFDYIAEKIFVEINKKLNIIMSVIGI